MDICIECNSKGDFTCLCSQAILCSTCIGFHFKKNPLVDHHPVPLPLSPVKPNVRKLIQAKINDEIQQIDQFESLGVKFVQELRKMTQKYLENAEQTLIQRVTSKCKQFRDELLDGLEAVKLEDFSNAIAQRFRDISSLDEIDNMKILNREIDFDEMGAMALHIPADLDEFEVVEPDGN